jgi:hypothetical protein
MQVYTVKPSHLIDPNRAQRTALGDRGKDSEGQACSRKNDNPWNLPTHPWKYFWGLGSFLNNGITTLLGVILFAGGLISFFSGIAQYLEKL